jgi:hypothetical protein
VTDTTHRQQRQEEEELMSSPIQDRDGGQQEPLLEVLAQDESTEMPDNFVSPEPLSLAEDTQEEAPDRPQQLTSMVVDDSRMESEAPQEEKETGEDVTKVPEADKSPETKVPGTSETMDRKELTSPPPALKDVSAPVQPPPPNTTNDPTTSNTGNGGGGLLRRLSRASLMSLSHSTTPHTVSFPLDPHAYQKPKKSNYIRTTKYTLLTFIPLNLYFQVHLFLHFSYGLRRNHSNKK